MTDVPGGSRSPNDAEVILAAIKCQDIEKHTGMPARVEKFDSKTQTADCKPLIRRRFQNPDGTELNESIAVIPRVPVAWPRAGRFIVTWPLKPGDLVELVVSESSRDAFQGGAGDETDPDDFRRFDLSDVWAYPGAGYPDSKAIKNFDPDDLVIGVDGGVVIHIKEDGTINLGSKTPADAVALAAKVLTELSSIVTAFNAHTHIGVTVGAGVTGTPSPPPLAAPSAVASTVVKSE